LVPWKNPNLGEKSRPQPPTYLRNIEKEKTEKKSWYQYVFLGGARVNEATEEGKDASF
jgi:hypothetical protein